MYHLLGVAEIFFFFSTFLRCVLFIPKGVLGNPLFWVIQKQTIRFSKALAHDEGDTETDRWSFSGFCMSSDGSYKYINDKFGYEARVVPMYPFCPPNGDALKVMRWPACAQVPPDFPRPTPMTNQGTTIMQSLGPALTKKLQDFSAKHHSSSLAVITMAAYYLLHHHMTNSMTLTIGSNFSMAQRSTPATADLIGMMVSTLPLHLVLSLDMTMRDLLHKVADVLKGAEEHSVVTLDTIVAHVLNGKRTKLQPFFQVVFDFQLPEMDLSALGLGDLKPSFYKLDRGLSIFDLTWNVERHEKGTSAREPQVLNTGCAWSLSSQAVLGRRGVICGAHVTSLINLLPPASNVLLLLEAHAGAHQVAFLQRLARAITV